ncbi:uncharacterized protein LOC105664282 [Megachile rotundata]|uniref:uncharacterized protein LOC105664282 n=1 Tax=Megachile rotundata TaxID=143995 RepID=UPI003FD674EF
MEVKENERQLGTFQQRGKKRKISTEETEDGKTEKRKDNEEERRIKICFLDATGIRKNNKFCDYIDEFDIVGIVEGWLESTQEYDTRVLLPETFKWKHSTTEFPHSTGLKAIVRIYTGVKCHIEENEVDIEEVIGIQERRPIIGKDEWRILTIFSIFALKTQLEDMISFTESRNVIIGGNFHARTASEGAIIWGPTETKQPRKSQDTIKDRIGDIMLEMVAENAWSIMNGNLKGDNGEFTFITAKDRSVIDYVIANVNARDRIMNFEVDCKVFWQLHRPLIIEIENQDQEKECEQIDKEYERKKLQQIKNEDQVWKYIYAEKETRVQTTKTVENDFTTHENEEIAMEITEDEIRNQIAKLNMEKTVDLNVLTEIINYIWGGRLSFESWQVPIDIKEAKHETNTRILTLKSTYTIYAMCLKEKLETELKTKYIIPETQAEFKSANGTVDNIFILDFIIKRELKKECGSVYAFFVKLTEAFDTVDRGELERMLETNGISDTLRTRIRDIYKETGAVKGLRKGCPLNPILFSLYIADLKRDMQKAKIEDLEIKEIKLRSFVNEDNIVLITKRPEDLKTLMEHLNSYLNRKKLNINCEKSKVLVFTRSAVERQEKWTFGERDIDEVQDYEYLNFHFEKNGGWTMHAKETAKRAMVVMAYAWDIGKRKFGDNIKERMMMFKQLVDNILLYGAEIWGAAEMIEIEKVQAKYIRLMLEEVIGESIENISTVARKKAEEYQKNIKK